MIALKLGEIAERINAHLKRIERDRKLNVADGGTGLRSYFNAFAWDAGRHVLVRYISYQSAFSMTKAEAAAYLKWLDAGNVGQHFELFRPGKR